MLGTYVDITLVGDLHEPELHHLCSGAFQQMRNIEQLMSFHDSASELSSINRLKPGVALELSTHTFEVCAFAFDLYTKSRGVFDPSVASKLVSKKLLPKPQKCLLKPKANMGGIELTPDSRIIRKHKALWLDFGGVAKGYAVDQAFEFLKSHSNLSYFSVNAGGDMRMSPHAGHSVYIRPHSNSQFKGKEVLMQRQACASSSVGASDSEPNSFIIDPFRNECISDASSISVFANTAMHADALTKVCLLCNDVAILRNILESYDATYLSHS